AEGILHNLSVLTAGDAEQETVHQLATELLKNVRRERDAQRRKSSLVSGAFRRATAHLAHNERGKARAVWASVIGLYRDNPAAKADVERARQLLRDYPPTPSKATSP
ncbi:MAG: hypothetical protein ACE5KM_24570, partial [Planctomycetaceae bacterium]